MLHYSPEKRDLFNRISGKAKEEVVSSPTEGLNSPREELTAPSKTGASLQNKNAISNFFSHVFRRFIQFFSPRFFAFVCHVKQEKMISSVVEHGDFTIQGCAL